MKEIEEFKKNWLLGTTCHRHGMAVFWTSDCKNFVIMKHHGHSEYVNRFTGTTRCGTYYALYNIHNKIDRMGYPALNQWIGRWRHSYFINVEKLMAKSLQSIK